jgi:antitoxin component of RelBE/YafQ-DinJ toxin-antitoxin module
MGNITLNVSIDDEIVSRAQEVARRLGKSLEDVVQDYLE